MPALFYLTIYSQPLSDIQLEQFIPEIIVRFGPSINIQLNNILPIPDEDIPIENILEFKRKRRDELQKFRIALDQLYLDTLSAVEKSKDPTRELEHGVNVFERELFDLKKAAGSSFFGK